MTCSSLLESFQVAPPPRAAAEGSLPLTFFDIIWLHFHPIRRLLFYDFPCSKAHFLESLIPKLKQSLSLALGHYFLLAGNSVYPLDDDEKPVIRYVVGDSVSLTVFESTSDFDYLVGNHPRDADVFYDFIPQLPPMISDEHNRKLLKLVAVQVTLFPGRGICIGLTNDHVVGDANSIVGFVRAWASICKIGGDDEYFTDASFPIFNRSLIKDPLGVDSVYWNQMKQIPMNSPPFPLPTNRVRATYVLDQSDIKKLKDSVMSTIPGFAHASSFVVTAAYVWTCLVKSILVDEEDTIKIDDDETEFFLFAVDSRGRLDPPVPRNYFGNCLGYGLGKVRHQDLAGPNGFRVAAQSIGQEIKNRVNDKEKFMEGVENWVTEISSVVRRRLFAVSGSTRVDLYSADFGWGEARKMEMLSIDGEKYAMSLCKSRDCEGGLEVGLSLPKVKMDAFGALFVDGLKDS